MISILVPLYDSDEYLGFTGTDVELKTLLSHLPAPDSRQGFLIFDQQGHIISAPNLRFKRSENSVTSGKAISIPALNNV
ncbi:hypothetical protein, partial [Pseudoalteromonas ruthenica]|uniref:hypothetical protein n=1 Tax=Pseudoalteromonas ruthenica TaxID=151081 RepID=UPI001BB15EEE